MALIRQYGDNLQDIGKIEVVTTDAEFEQYIEKYGIERALGYLDAVTGFTAQVHLHVLLDHRDSTARMFNSEHVTGVKIRKLIQEKRTLIKLMKAVMPK